MKDIVNKVKMQAKAWEKILAITVIGFVSRSM